MPRILSKMCLWLLRNFHHICTLLMQILILNKLYFHHYYIKRETMRHLENIIDNLKAMYENPNTVYAPTEMFDDKNQLSFAISRLQDAKYVFTDDIIDSKAITPELSTLWFNMRENMPEDTAKVIAICIIKNTPLSRTEDEINQIQKMFHDTLLNFTKSEELSNIFTDIIFGEPETKMPRMKDY